VTPTVHATRTASATALATVPPAPQERSRERRRNRHSPRLADVSPRAGARVTQVGPRARARSSVAFRPRTRDAASSAPQWLSSNVSRAGSSDTTCAATIVPRGARSREPFARRAGSAATSGREMPRNGFIAGARWSSASRSRCVSCGGPLPSSNAHDATRRAQVGAVRVWRQSDIDLGPVGAAGTGDANRCERRGHSSTGRASASSTAEAVSASRKGVNVSCASIPVVSRREADRHLLRGWQDLLMPR
jgi:hypothetical protein